MLRLLAALLLTITSDRVLTAATIEESERIALVIGNANYHHTPPLTNPHRDARLVVASLRRLGFDVEDAILDADKPSLEAALRTFAVRASQSRQAIVFFAGHGLVAMGKNHLVPVDARLTEESMVSLEAVSLDDVTTVVSGAKELGLVILDACNDNPLSAKMKQADKGRNVVRGMVPVTPTAGNILVAFAAKAGTRAVDGEPSSNSPYTQALAEELNAPHRDVRILFGAVRDRVIALTAGAQEPAIYGTLGGKEVRLAKDPTPVMLGAKSDAELMFWHSTEKQGTIEAYNAYVQLYPEGEFQSLANQAIERLRNLGEQCDALAASPFDTTRPESVPGVFLEAIDSSSAELACQQIAENSSDERYWFQFARALHQAQKYALAAHWYRKAAEAGHSHSMSNLGVMYSNGFGVELDERTAFTWYEKSATAGSAVGMTKLAIAYQQGSGVTSDDHAAVRYFTMASEQGYAEASAELAFMYEKGRGTEIKLQRARELYEKAAEGGSTLGMNNLGYCYEHATCAERNERTARDWYEKAARLGNSTAMVNLADSMLKSNEDDPLAAPWYLKAAESGHIGGMFGAGLAYRYGNGVVVNTPLALHWLRKAAEGGKSGAMVELAFMYQDGIGLESKDAQLAFHWYQEAARLGDPSAFNGLGFLYQFGMGVKKDLAMAVAWYEKAAAAGNSSAMANLGYLSEKGLGVKQDYKKAERWYRDAIELGNSTGMNNLGLLFETGRGRRANQHEARALYQRAAVLNNITAMMNLARHLIAHSPKDPAEAEVWFRRAAEAGNEEAEEWLRDKGL